MSILLKLWRLFVPETEADRLREKAEAVAAESARVAWDARRDFYEAEIWKAATLGRNGLNVGVDDAWLFGRGMPGEKWAESRGCWVGRDGEGHGYMGSWPMVRWS